MNFRYSYRIFCGRAFTRVLFLSVVVYACDVYGVPKLYLELYSIGGSRLWVRVKRVKRNL